MKPYRYSVSNLFDLNYYIKIEGLMKYSVKSGLKPRMLVSFENRIAHSVTALVISSVGIGHEVDQDQAGSNA